MAIDSKMMKVAYTVCGHAIEKKASSNGVGKARAFLSRRKASGPKRVQAAYGWCPLCTEFYRYDIRSTHCILKFWKFKRDHSMIGAVPQSAVCGSVLFDMMKETRDTLDWPMPLEDMGGFLQAIEYTPDPADVRAYRDQGWSRPDAELAAKYAFAVKMREATLEWAQGIWDQNWIRIPAGILGTAEVHAPILPHIPQHPKPGRTYPVLFDPSTRCPVIPESRPTTLLPPPRSAFQAQPDLENSPNRHRGRNPSPPPGQHDATTEVCFRLDYESSSPSFVEVSIDSSTAHWRKAALFLNLSSQSRSAASPISASPRRCPQSAPPRPSFRLATCSQHGSATVLDDCEECKRIRHNEIAIPPSFAEERGCKSAPLLVPDEYIYCTQPLCFCREVGQDDCPTCPLRAKSTAEGLAWL